MELVRDIREQIRSGRLQPGDRLPSFDELRQRWGVGRDTLERMYKILETEGLVTREHRRGVFIADPRARTTTGTIGFVSGARLHHHPYYVHLLAGVREAASEAGIEVLLLDRETSIRWEKVDGVIYQATLGRPMTHLLRMPQVSLVYARDNLDCAMADDYIGTRESLDFLRHLGHTRIAFLTSEKATRAMSHQRMAAYQEALAEWGEAFNSARVRMLGDPGVAGETWEQIGYDDMTRWLREDWRELGCTAILAQNDETAVGVIQALHDAGLSVPRDVSVIGFDGTEIASYHRPRLTTVQVPLREIGARGFELLMQQLRESQGTEGRESREGSERLPVRLVLPTKLVVGETTAHFKR